MNKVGYRKTHITDFINQKEQQALDAVQNEYKNMYNATLCSIIAKVPGFNDELIRAKNYLDSADSLLNHIRKIALENTFVFKNGYSYLGHEEEFRKYDPLGMLAYKMTDKDGLLYGIKDAEKEQLNKTRCEYAKVKNQLNRMTKPVEMRKYLESLGFDMSFLDKYTRDNVVTVEEIQSIEKKNLFPYKELTVNDNKNLARSMVTDASETDHSILDDLADGEEKAI